MIFFYFFYLFIFFRARKGRQDALMRTKMVYTNRMEILNCEIQTLVLVYVLKYFEDLLEPLTNHHLRWLIHDDLL